MVAVLTMIYCWLNGWVSMFNDWAVTAFDGVLSAGDYFISAVDVTGLAVPDFSGMSSYLWLAGASGLDIALGLIVGALILRVTLQTIPFVRWGS